MKAIISDIHGNYEALKAVFADIDRHNVKEIYFLGDVVGYGPEPEPCIDLIEKRCKVHLIGNHDFAMLNVPLGFNPIAKGAIACLKSRMQPGMYSMPAKRRRWKYLGRLKANYVENDMLFIHASPRDPISEYILPNDATKNPQKVYEIFQYIDHIAFYGHTHLPGVMTPEPRWYFPEELDYHYKIGKEKAFINIGSVGQPRDQDPRACYILLDKDEIYWRRVEYNIDKTIEKINKNPGLHERNATRLLEGK